MANTKASPTNQQIKEMVEDYSSGKSLQKISKEVGFSVPTISKYLKAEGVIMRNKGRRSGVDYTASNPNYSEPDSSPKETEEVPLLDNVDDDYCGDCEDEDSSELFDF